MRTQAEITEHRKLVFKQFKSGRNGDGPAKSAAVVKAALADQLDPTYVNEALRHFTNTTPPALGSRGKGPGTRYFRPAKQAT